MNAWAKLCATNSTTVLSSLFIYKPDSVELISSEGLNGRVLVADLGGLTVDNATVPRLVELIKGAPSLEALLLRQGTTVTIDDVAAAQTLADVALEHNVSLAGSIRGDIDEAAFSRIHLSWFPEHMTSFENSTFKNAHVWAIFVASEVKVPWPRPSPRTSRSPRIRRPARARPPCPLSVSPLAHSAFHLC